MNDIDKYQRITGQVTEPLLPYTWQAMFMGCVAQDEIELDLWRGRERHERVCIAQEALTWPALVLRRSGRG